MTDTSRCVPELLLKQEYAVGDFIAGEFRVLAVLGGPGKSGQGVVLKTFQELGTNSKVKLVAEGKVWVALGYHPNIIPIQWVKELDFRLFIAAEFVPPDAEGRTTLQDHILEGPQPIPRICKWIAHFCDGISFAVGRGLLSHGDVKPSNLLVDRAGTLRITDFGLARLVGSGDAELVPAGPLPYMAPEQFDSPESVSVSADIYAIGIVLYQLITGGSYPYKMPEKIVSVVGDFAKAHLNAPIIRIDTPFWPILEKCLTKDAAGRPTLAELRREVSTLADRARVTLMPIPQIDHDDDELYARAQSLAALGQAPAALESIEEYTRRYPQHPWGWTEKSVIFLHLGQLDASIAATRESLRRDSGNSHAWNNLGVALLEKGQDDEAANAFRLALEHDPYNTASMASLAGILARKGKTETPAKLLVLALKLHPKKKMLLHNATINALQIVKNGAREEARELLESLTQNEPGIATNWFFLAGIHKIAERFEEAIDCYRKAIDLGPQDSAALICLAECLGERSRLSEAIEICERCLQIGAKREEALVLKAYYLDRQGHYSAAASMLADELTSHPNAATLWFTLAIIHHTNSALSEAQSALLTCKSILVQEKQFDTDAYRMVDANLWRLQGKPLDAMALLRELGGHCAPQGSHLWDDPQFLEKLKALNGGIDPPFRDRQEENGAVRTYSLPDLGVGVWLADGCYMIMFPASFRGALPLGLKWGESIEEVRQRLGPPQQTFPFDNYHFSPYVYSLHYNSTHSKRQLTSFTVGVGGLCFGCKAFEESGQR
jgi:serine/threonine protein kinase